ncbi:MAG TPA: AAA family ATPase [Tepidiformaceae bacterium]|nr:AAA family ATPase [Tepidiformaceae bacterium]
MHTDRPATGEPLIVERDAELDTLATALAAGRRGTPSVVLIVGEPGMGKSCLLQAVGRHVGEATVLRGYALEADAPPYFPFRRALARLARTGYPGATALPSPLLRSAGVLPADVAIDTDLADVDRLAVFDALTELLIALADEQPVVMILDDMQWASAATWEAVGYIARAAEGARLTLVLASRPEGIEPPNAGSTAVTELNRNRLLRLLTLKPLSEDGIRRLVTNSTGGEPAARLVSVLASRTGGNPFFLEEILRSLREAGLLVSNAGRWDLSEASTGAIPIPDTLRLAIWQRLDRLPDGTRSALLAGAILGRSFDSRLLGAVLGQPPEWVSWQLLPASRAGIVAEEAPGRWTFVHDTLREAVVEQVGESGRELHRKAAAALADVDPGDDLQIAAAIAIHLRLGGSDADAVAASLRASDLALLQHAADEALEFAATAERLHFSVANRPGGVALRDIQAAVARAATAAGDYERAERAWEAVLRSQSDPTDKARTLVQLGLTAGRAERVVSAAHHLEAALGLLHDGSDTRTLIDALVELATLEGTTLHEYQAAVGRGERALELARDLGDRRLEARAALALANARARGETPAAARELLSHALDLSLQMDDLVIASEAAASLSNSYYWTGELRSALRYGEDRLRIAERGRDVFALRHAHSWLALLATTAGDWQRADEMIALAQPAIARMGSPEPLGFLRLVDGLLAVRTGDTERALARTEEAMRLLLPLGDATISWYVAVRIWALLAAGQTAQAIEECALQESRLAAMPDSALPARSSRCGLGLIYAALGDRERGAACEEKLLPFPDDFHWRPARLTLAALAALRGDRSRALDLLDWVESFAERQGLDYDLADVRRIRAASQAGASPEQAFGQPRVHPPAVKGISAQRGRLSPREREVLELVAQGLTNRDIAERLVLSERTVINHVSHIFEKIDVDNRAAATAFAFRSGLVPDR